MYYIKRRFNLHSDGRSPGSSDMRRSQYRVGNGAGGVELAHSGHLRRMQSPERLIRECDMTRSRLELCSDAHAYAAQDTT